MARPLHRKRNNTLFITLLCSTALFSQLPFMAGTAQAQTAAAPQSYQFNIPAKSMSVALTEIGAVSGWRIAYAFSLPSTVKSISLSGTMTAEQAIARLLSGTDIRYRVTGERSIVLEKQDISASGGATPAGSIQLNTITIGTGINPAHVPFETSGSSVYLSAEQIENVKGTSPGDLFTGIAGVMNGENRNSGSVDVNIRGLQGQGRAPVVVDGSMQETTVYRGYNGAQSRSYIDPDFIGSVSIEKGQSTGLDANGAVGGIVRMDTIGAKDILLPEKNIGIRLKGGFNTNSTSAPALGTPGGIRGAGNYGSSPVPDEFGSQQGMDRPAFLTPSGGSGSVAIAGRTDNFEVIGAYARRKNGNYYAGKQGDDAAYPIITDTNNRTSVSYGGLSQYRAGEEVLNTSLDNESWLLKGKYISDNGHALELGYMKYSSTYGEIMPTQIWNTFGSGPYQGYLNDVELDTYTARYNWKPDDNDLIDLKINAYYTDMQLKINSAMNNGTQITPVLWYNATKRKGINADNTSRFETAFGDLSLSYGIGFSREDLGYPDGYTYKPSDNMDLGPGREGHRDEWNAVTSAEWKPTDWLTFSPSIRYSHYKSLDFNPGLTNSPSGLAYTHGDPIRNSDGGWSPMATLTVEPLDGWRIYGKAGSALRSPSAFEALKGFSFADFGDTVNVSPERNKSYEIGTSYLTNGIFLPEDTLRLHGAYFNNNVKNFLTRTGVPKEMFPGFYYEYLTLVNLDYAKMSGIEMTADYDTGKYFGGISWNHYLKTMYCAKDGTLLAKRTQCAEGGLYNSYTLQQVPPKDTVTVHLGARFFDEKLTVGSRIIYVGKRMVEGIGDGSEDTYMGGQLHASKWNPYTIVDLYMNYKHAENLEFNAGIDNLTDRYYMDALNASLMPAPGRTFRFNMTAKF
jgi:hemoglobin/transferrin/lactoferrin receptor protein